MRNFDFEPFFRSSIGFDRMFELLDRAVDVESEPGYPAYNIEKTGEDTYRLTVAVAGFKPTELSVVAEGMTLTVTGAKPLHENDGFLYRGIADQSFKRSFQLAEYMKVMSAKLENGLLWIELKREVPEAVKPRKINVYTPASKAVPFTAAA
jgi:molecular chaperone IbpA